MATALKVCSKLVNILVKTVSIALPADLAFSISICFLTAAVLSLTSASPLIAIIFCILASRSSLDIDVSVSILRIALSISGLALARDS